MFNKYKKKITLILLLITSISVLGILNKSNHFNNTIFVEYSPNYMNGNNEIEYIKLHQNNNEENIRFNVTNMLPGDTETKNYCINVSYKGDITLKYSANIESNYKKIEDIFKFKVKLINNSEILYDGPIKNMPKTLEYQTSSDKSISEDFCYEITAYLDTAVGNEFQDKEITIDFKWTVDEENLEPESNPATSDNIILWVSLAAVSIIVLLLILLTIKKERNR